MPEQLRILAVLPFPPRTDAVHGGARASAQLLDRLANRHRVGVVCLRSDEDEEADASLARKLEFVREIPWKQPPVGGVAVWRRRLLLVDGWRRGLPMRVVDVGQASVGEQLQDLVSEWRPDVLQVEHHVMMQFANRWPDRKVPIAFIEYEPGVVSAADAVSAAAGLGRIVAVLDAHAWGEYETRAVGIAELVIVFTSRDAATLHRLVPAARIEVLPLTIDVPARRPIAEPTNPPFILFVGNYTHPPNVDAAVRLATRIYPVLKRRHPALRLLLVGPGGGRTLLNLASEGVEVLGRVADVGQYLLTATAVVIPIRQGGGMRLKVMEALASGTAIVASALAIEGLGVVPGRDLLVAESDTEFVAGVGQLLLDPNRRAELAAGAYQWAKSHLDWDDRMRRLEALYSSLVASGVDSA